MEIKNSNPTQLSQKRGVSWGNPIQQRLNTEKSTFTKEFYKLRLSSSAGQTLESYLSLEEQNLLLEETYKQASDHPYQQVPPDFTQLSSYNIPPYLAEKFRSNSESTCLGGILPELKRVWYSLDNLLFLWEWSKETFMEFSGMQDVIVNVSAVERNSEVFTSKVHSVLVVSTRTEISLLGVVMQPNFKLVQSDIRIPTDEVGVDFLLPLDNGRIIIGGDDGNVSELKFDYYSWFSSAKKYKRQGFSSNILSAFVPTFLKNYSSYKVVQLSYDPSRNLLYALVENKNRPERFRIEVYDLGPYSEKNKKLVTINSQELLQRLRQQSPKLLSLSPERLKICYISAVKRNQTLQYHFLALAKNGIRIFFTFEEVVSDLQIEDEFLQKRPSQHYAITIKFPPSGLKVEGTSYSGMALGFTSDKSTNFAQGLLSQEGKLILAEKSEDTVRVVCVRKNLFRIAKLQGERGAFTLEPDESVSFIQEIQGELQSICEVPLKTSMPRAAAQLCNCIPKSEYRMLGRNRYLGSPAGTVSIECMNALSNILYIPPSEVLVLTSYQLIKYLEVRPIDSLYKCLLEAPSADIQHAKHFLEKYGSVHVCAMFLALLTSETTIHFSKDLVKTPLKEPVREKAYSMFKQFGNMKVSDTFINSYRPEDPLMSLAEYKALYIHLSRIVRPLWGEYLSYYEGDITNQLEQFTPEQLRIPKTNLLLFKKFLEESYKETCTDLSKFNQNPVVNLFVLVLKLVDTLELLCLLGQNHSFRRVVSLLSTEDQEVLASSTFRDFVCTTQGHSLAKSLIESYITHLQNPRVPRQKKVPIQECLALLISKCPSYFTQSDSEIYVAEEYLRRAKQEKPTEDYIDQAMQRLLRNAAMVDLKKVVGELKYLQVYKGLVQLCLEKAKALIDIEEDPSFCYEFVFELLEEIHSSKSNFKKQELQELRRDIVDECCKTNDKKLHWAVFNWLNEVGAIQEIISTESIYIKEYIQKFYSPEVVPESSLLARYCMKMQDYLTAFQEFGRLACLSQPQADETQVILLEDRLEFFDLSNLCLDKYIQNFKGTPTEMQQLLDEKDNLGFYKQLAKIQLSIKLELKSRLKVSLNENEAAAYKDPIHFLDRSIFSLQELLKKFARPYFLFEPQFEILDLSRKRSKIPTDDELTAMQELFEPLIHYYQGLPWPNEVISKLEEIGNKYPFAFNLSVVISLLEKITAHKQVQFLPVINLLLNLKIEEGFAEIWDVYQKLIHENLDRPELLSGLLIRTEELLKKWITAVRKKEIQEIIGGTVQEKCHINKFEERIPRIWEFFSQMVRVMQVLPVNLQQILLKAFQTHQREIESLTKELKAIPKHAGTKTSPFIQRKRLNFSDNA